MASECDDGPPLDKCKYVMSLCAALVPGHCIPPCLDRQAQLGALVCCVDARQVQLA